MYLATLRGAGGFEKRLVVKQIRAELASDEAFVHRFVAEAKTTVELSHPNIVPVYELGVEQGVYFIAMELARGVTLSELLRHDGRLSPEEGAYLGVEICRALDYAHRRSGIVHRDVTPRNVLVDDEGAVRLIDFGIAAPVSVDGSPRERVYGSPGHMPVEQLRGGRLTPATDVFAVAALLVEAWTATPPFRRATRAESDAALFDEQQPLSRSVPELSSLDHLVASALSQEASARPQSAEDFARPLREFLRSADLGDIARRLGERVRRARRISQAEAGSAGALTPATPPMSSITSSGAAPPPITPVTRPLTQPVTETFAYRDEVDHWIGATSDPPPDDARDGIDESRAAPEAPPPVPRRGGVVATIAAIAITAVAALAVLATRHDEKHPTDAATPATANDVRATASVEVPTSAVRSVRDVAVAAAPLATAAAPRGSAGASRFTPETESSSRPVADVEGESRASATLVITSDLPAKVTIDGAPQGATPLRSVKRAPGRHVIGLSSIELGERLSATVDAKPGSTVAVHAEFTRPVPVLRVH